LMVIPFMAEPPIQAHRGAIGSIRFGSSFLTLPTRVLTGKRIISPVNRPQKSISRRFIYRTLQQSYNKNFRPCNPYPGHPQRDLIVGDDGQFFDCRRVASNTAWMPNQACSGSASREVSPSRAASSLLLRIVPLRHSAWHDN
jgi:hypothetical protein